MILLLSGEGPTDIGASPVESGCRGDVFVAGPMARIIEKVLTPILNYEVVEQAREEGCEEMLHFVPEKQLKHLEPTEPKKVRFAGLKGTQGTKFHFKFAELLGRHALKIEAREGEPVLAVFFRDADATNTTPTTEWQEKWNSICQGFQFSRFERGVPMLPKPKSEAWLLCAWDKNYTSCADLEDAPGNDASPNSLKKQLAATLGKQGSAQELAEKVASELDVDKLEMPSFNAFKNRLVQAASEA